MNHKPYFFVLVILLAIASESCNKQSDSLQPEEKKSLGDSTQVKLNAHLKQESLNIANAKILIRYVLNGDQVKDSVYTDTPGNASFLLPLNTQAKLTITSHCGTLLYERKFGPFTAAGTVDTTFRVVAYSPACETEPPSEYITYLENGVNHRLIYPGDNISFFRTSSTECNYSIKKAGGVDGAGIDCLLEAPGLGMMMWAGPNYKYGTSPGSVTYTETGTIGQYMAGTFEMDLSHLTPETLHPDTEYKINGTFRFKIRPRTDDPNYMLFE